MPSAVPARRLRLVLGALGSVGVLVACAGSRSTEVAEPTAAAPPPAAATASGGSSSVAATSTPPASLTLLYDSDRTGTYQVYRLDLATGAVTQLTSDPAYDSWWARISPDGTEMIFNRTPAGVHDTDYAQVSLWKANIDGSDARQIVARGQHGWVIQGHADWSPDGTRLVMYGGSSIWVTDADGNPLNPVTNGIDPVWSADGSRIIFVTCAGAPWCVPGTHRISSIEPDGTDLRHLTPVLPQRSANDPTMSPDGSTITWQANVVGNRWDLLAMDSDGTDLRTLFADGFMNSNPVWSPDGDRIYLYKNKPFHDHINVWSIRPDGSDLTLVTEGQPGINEMADVGRAQ